jgi:hypothetical protein
MTDKVEEACEGMWFAVIRQAIDDAKSIEMWEGRMAMYDERRANAPNVAAMRAARQADQQAKAERDTCEDAKRWLTKPNRDFNEVCRYLNLDPDLTRELVTKILDNGLELGHNLLRPNGEYTSPRTRKETAHAPH